MWKILSTVFKENLLPSVGDEVFVGPLLVVDSKLVIKTTNFGGCGTLG